jgi:hypothetical protein
MNNTPYNLADDGNTYKVTSGTRFVNLAASDSTMGGSGGSECKQVGTAYGDGRDYHDSWYLLNPGAPLSGGTDGTVYRLHTTGTDPGNLAGTAQKTTNGEQSFALYMSATGATGSPRIYGLGAMQAFTPLCAGGYTASGYTCPIGSTSTSSEFYLAQIDAVHAGKTVQIQLWDPGDTCATVGSNCLAANLQILLPTTAGWTPTSFTWAGKVGTSDGNANSACNTNTGTASSVATSVSTSTLGRFNGCWLTISVVVPDSATYALCTDGSGNAIACQDGWWKIRYNMTGTGASNDVTTWKVTIRGNPVHLKVP